MSKWTIEPVVIVIITALIWVWKMHHTSISCQLPGSINAFSPSINLFSWQRISCEINSLIITKLTRPNNFPFGMKPCEVWSLKVHSNLIKVNHMTKSAKRIVVAVTHPLPIGRPIRFNQISTSQVKSTLYVSKVISHAANHHDNKMSR